MRWNMRWNTDVYDKFLPLSIQSLDALKVGNTIYGGMHKG